MKQKIALVGILIIHLLFAYKYFLRFSEYSWIITLIYLIVTTALFIILNNHNFKWLYSPFIYFGIVAAYTISFILVYKLVDPLTLKPDRWSVITNFWQTAFNGGYPYGARSHMGNYPGPMPVYFVLALPFAWINEIGYFSIMGFIILAVFYRKKLESKSSLTVLVLFITSIAIFWEMFVRSTIIVNAALFLLYIYWFQYVNLNKRKDFWLSAIIAGLLLSTRSVFILPLLIALVYILKSKEYSFNKLMLWGIIFVLSFFVTFIPFILLYPDDFFHINPFIVQGGYILPTWFTVIFIIIAAIGGLFCKKKSDIIFICGSVFLLFFLVYAGFNFIRYGIHNSYIESKTDISYSLFSFPFLLYSLYPEKSNLFNSKMLSQ